MAHQPKAYKKFVATAATATLVASAIAPVVSAAETKSFTDVSSAYADAVNYLVAEGITQGTSATTFGTTQNITRGDAAVFIARALKLDVDNAKDQGFTDLNSRVKNAVNAVVAAEIASGKSATTFAPEANITRQEMAKMLANAYKLTAKEKANFSDVNSNWIEYVSALKEAGITLGKTETTFAPTANLTRGEFALFMYRAEGEPVVGEVALTSVKAVKAKTIEVTFNKATDAVAADFTVTKGSVKANVVSVALSEDKKTATIELTSKLTEGEYTVTVAQKDKDALKGSVVVTNERVSKIEITSDLAPITGADATTATVGAKVLNQYGEDITSLNFSDVTETVGGAASKGTLSKEGVLTLDLIPTAKEGDSIFVTLVHAKTGVSTQATVKVSRAAAVSEISFGKVYNKDGKTLNQDTDFSKDKFYLPIVTKDQYGKEVTSTTTLNKELVITNTNPAVATVDTTIKSVKIDNKDVNVVEVTGTNLAGSTNLIAVSKTTGTNTTTTLNVEAGVKVASLAVNSPQELVTAGKDVYFPLTIIDTEGKEYKTKKEFDSLSSKDPITVSQGGEIVEVKDKGLFVKVDGNSVKENQPVTVVVTSLTGKVSTQTVISREAAKAVVITGLSSKIANALRSGDTTGITIKNTDLVVEDQFGQVIKDTTELAKITFTVDAIPSEVFDVKVADDKKSVVIKPKDFSKAKSSSLTFMLLEGTTEKESSAFTKVFSVVEDSQFASYEVEDVDTMYAYKDDDGSFKVSPTYNQDLVVLAKTASGETVELTEGANADYTVVGKPADNGVVTFAKDAKEAKVTVTITINRTGAQLTKELTYSNVAPKAVDFFVTSTTATDATKAKAIDEPILVEGAFTAASLYTTDAKIVTTDQYGLKDFVGEAFTATIIPSDASKVTITGNGSKLFKVEAKEETTVTAKITIGGATKEVKVKVKPAAK